MAVCSAKFEPSGCTVQNPQTWCDNPKSGDRKASLRESLIHILDKQDHVILAQNSFGSDAIISAFVNGKQVSNRNS